MDIKYVDIKIIFINELNVEIKSIIIRRVLFCCAIDIIQSFFKINTYMNKEFRIGNILIY